jgi:hypothetical protein
LLAAAAMVAIGLAGGRPAPPAAQIAAGGGLTLLFAALYIMAVFTPAERGMMRAWIVRPSAEAA